MPLAMVLVGYFAFHSSGRIYSDGAIDSGNTAPDLTNPGNQTNTVGDTVTLTISAVNGVAQVRFTPNEVGATAITAAVSGVADAAATLRVLALNPIYVENQLPGTSAWQITNPVGNADPEIAGYADSTSYSDGDTIDFKVSLSGAGTYRIDLYRLGYYQGDGGHLIATFRRFGRRPTGRLRGYRGYYPID